MFPHRAQKTGFSKEQLVQMLEDVACRRVLKGTKQHQKLSVQQAAMQWMTVMAFPMRPWMAIAITGESPCALCTQQTFRLAVGMGLEESRFKYFAHVPLLMWRHLTGALLLAMQANTLLAMQPVTAPSELSTQQPKDVMSWVMHAAESHAARKLLALSVLAPIFWQVPAENFLSWRLIPFFPWLELTQKATSGSILVVMQLVTAPSGPSVKLRMHATNWVTSALESLAAQRLLAQSVLDMTCEPVLAASSPSRRCLLLSNISWLMVARIRIQKWRRPWSVQIQAQQPLSGVAQSKLNRCAILITLDVNQAKHTKKQQQFVLWLGSVCAPKLRLSNAFAAVLAAILTVIRSGSCMSLSILITPPATV
jgi:hypothetical protein